MQSSLQYGAIKKFRRTPWRFQQTFRTPLRSLASFTATILGALDHADSGTVVIDAVAMPPAKLNTLLSQEKLSSDLRHDMAIVAETTHELESLLAAALGGCVDFLFVPSPKPFVLYADHDEYSTFFANSKKNLNVVTCALTAQGFATVENYIRTS
jgi:hypothetical protein